MKQRILFANIGWMAHYRGITSSDRIIGGGSYNPDDKHEVYNFLNIEGKYYGFVQSGEMNLSRIDENYDGSGRLDNVLVIWTAPNSKLGGRCVVGWYRNATVYANYIDSSLSVRKKYSYNIVADAKDCVLLPPDNRNKMIPTGKGFFGRYLIWYADGATCTNKTDKSKVNAFKAEILEYIKDLKSIHPKKRNFLSADSKAKAEVEKAAVDYVSAHYKKLGYTIKDVQKDNVGWDLEASMKKLTLKLEVKGLANDVVDVLISNNEYSKMNTKENQDEYRLCVVINAINDPELITFLHYGNDWVAEDDPEIILEFKARTIEATIKK